MTSAPTLSPSEFVLVFIGCLCFPFWFVHLPGLNIGPGDIAVILAGVSYVYRTGTWPLFADRTIAWATFLFLSIAGLSMVWTPLPGEGVRQFLQYGLIFGVIVPMLVTAFRSREKRWTLVMALWLILGTVTAAGALDILLTSPVLDRYSFVYGSQNTYYWIVASGVIVSLFFALDLKSNSLLRFLVVGVAGLGIVMVVLGLTLTAILAMVAGIWIFALHLANRSSRKGLLQAFVFLTLFVGVVAVGGIATYWEFVYRQGALYSRIPMYTEAFTVGLYAFPFGTGIGSSKIAMNGLPSHIPRVTHNFVLHYWVTVGVVGVFAFVVLITRWIRLTALDVLCRPCRWSHFEVGLVAVFVTYIFVAFFQPPPVRRFWWMFYALGLSIIRDV